MRASLPNATAATVSLYVALASAAFAAGAHIGNSERHATAADILRAHESRPHADAIHREEYRDDVDQIRRELTRIRRLIESGQNPAAREPAHSEVI